MRFPFILIAAILAYLPLILASQPVNPDAQFIITNLTEAGSYFEKLFTLRTIDVQPVRDLSLALDILVYRLSGFNSMVLQNVILWAMAVTLLLKIMELEFREKFRANELLVVALLFAVYPLFSQTVSWGMARKHILAFLFTLAAVYQLLRSRRGFTVFYTLAVLSQPITILLPVWAILMKFSEERKIPFTLMPSFVAMVIIGAINFLYYQSSFFISLFGQKTQDAFSLPDKILALGHYSFQLIFPYFLSLYYTLGHWQVLAGLIPFAALLILLIRVKSLKASLWILFAALPLGVVLIKATTLYDTYLLLPAAGVLLAVLTLTRRIHVPVCAALFFIFFIITAWNTLPWRDEVKLMEKSFSARPDCLTALHYLRMTYENGLRPTDPAPRNMLRSQDCGGIKVPPQQLAFVEASFLFYETELTPARREKRLRELLNFGIFPHFALIGFYIEFKREEEAREEMTKLLSRWRTHRFKPEYISLVHKTIAPFCEKQGLTECTQFIQPFLEKPDALVYQ